MLELITLYVLCKQMGKILRAKGWKPLTMQVMVVVTWIGSMLLGAFGYGIYIGLTKGPEAAENLGFAVYPIMLVSALVAESCLFGIALVLTKKQGTAEPLPIA